VKEYSGASLLVERWFNVLSSMNKYSKTVVYPEIFMGVGGITGPDICSMTHCN
jgi:hypothetical protein